MNLANEASYLYVYAKELTSINNQLKKLSKKAEKHVIKHSKAKTGSKKLKHKFKHLKTSQKIEKLMKKHNSIIKKLQYHNTAFYHALRKENKI